MEFLVVRGRRKKDNRMLKRREWYPNTRLLRLEQKNKDKNVAERDRKKIEWVWSRNYLRALSPYFPVSRELSASCRVSIFIKVIKAKRL
ncbi:hypothetical protein V1477_010353 [Vespula maculifrons]|uniref:Uncharacterized protein n=1 Tax=Vespula maculifrons TaxID=7453 RepID=A0ABD2C8A5_VESMC